jgi:hypothetical protein
MLPKVKAPPKRQFDPTPDGRGTPVKVKGKSMKASDMLGYMKSSRRATVVHSDGFLAFETEPAYECPKCYFHGFFVSDVCHRCGEPIG